MSYPWEDAANRARASYRPPVRPTPVNESLNRVGAWAAPSKPTYTAATPTESLTNPLGDRSKYVVTDDVRDAYWRNQYSQADAAARRLQPTTPPMTFGGSGGGGGGGGGGGAAGPNVADYNKYVEAMRAYLTSGAWKAGAITPQRVDLMSIVNPAVAKERAEAKDAFGRVAAGVSMADPYLSLIGANAPTVDPRLAQFAASQGVAAPNTAEAQGGVDFLARNYDALARVLGQNFLTGQRGVVDVANQQGALVDADFASQLTAAQAQEAMLNQQYAAQAAQQQQAQQQALDAARRDAVLQLIATGLQYGTSPNLQGLV